MLTILFPGARVAFVVPLFGVGELSGPVVNRLRRVVWLFLQKDTAHVKVVCVCV